MDDHFWYPCALGHRLTWQETRSSYLTANQWKQSLWLWPVVTDSLLLQYDLVLVWKKVLCLQKRCTFLSLPMFKNKCLIESKRGLVTEAKTSTSFYVTECRAVVTDRYAPETVKKDPAAESALTMEVAGIWLLKCHVAPGILGWSGTILDGISDYAPQFNGTCERNIRTVMNMMRSMSKSADLPNDSWPKARCATCYIKNWFTTSKKPTPFEL